MPYFARWGKTDSIAGCPLGARMFLAWSGEQLPSGGRKDPKTTCLLERGAFPERAKVAPTPWLGSPLNQQKGMMKTLAHHFETFRFFKFAHHIDVNSTRLTNRDQITINLRSEFNIKIVCSHHTLIKNNK